MLIITVEINVKPEQRQAAIAAMRKVATATQAETGCLMYQFHVDMEDSNRFFLFEKWGSEESLAAHQQSTHMAELGAQFPNILASDLAITIYNAELLS